MVVETHEVLLEMQWFGGFVVYYKNRPGVMWRRNRVLGAVPVVGALWSLECVRSTG